MSYLLINSVNFSYVVLSSSSTSLNAKTRWNISSIWSFYIFPGVLFNILLELFFSFSGSIIYYSMQQILPTPCPLSLIMKYSFLSTESIAVASIRLISYFVIKSLSIIYLIKFHPRS